jgi:hypothetical protein
MHTAKNYSPSIFSHSIHSMTLNTSFTKRDSQAANTNANITILIVFRMQECLFFPWKHTAKGGQDLVEFMSINAF